MRQSLARLLRLAGLVAVLSGWQHAGDEARAAVWEVAAIEGPATVVFRNGERKTLAGIEARHADQNAIVSALRDLSRGALAMIERDRKSKDPNAITLYYYPKTCLEKGLASPVPCPIMVNAWLLEMGWARVAEHQAFSHRSEFERIARESRRL